MKNTKSNMGESVDRDSKIIAARIAQAEAFRKRKLTRNERHNLIHNYNMEEATAHFIMALNGIDREMYEQWRGMVSRYMAPVIEYDLGEVENREAERFGEEHFCYDDDDEEYREWLKEQYEKEQLEAKQSEELEAKEETI